MSHPITLDARRLLVRMASLSLKAANKQRKAAATNVINNAAAQAAWGAIGLMPVPSANIKRGHSNGNRRGVGASKSIISNSCMTGRYINVTACREHAVGTIHLYTIIVAV